MAERLLVDPSLLLSLPGLTWLQQDDAAREAIVVSAAFRNSLDGLRDRLSYPLLPSSDLSDLLARRDILRELLERVETFSHRDANLEGNLAVVGQALLDLNDPDAEVFADEWAYLQTHSIMLSALRRSLDAFRHAGGAVLEFGERVRDRVIDDVVARERRPTEVTRGFLTKVGAKWLVVRGAPYIGTALGAAFGIPIPEIPPELLELLPLEQVIVALDP